ncbi:hypothetical protein [Rhizobium sp. R339]|uniref:hypothetical protein n=1 Tax=Rhizobium sp. R339 TaxID=1764273 RepID=UPI0011302122|nr:hypothetical protein [Rhizobium sp. R339]
MAKERESEHLDASPVPVNPSRTANRQRAFSRKFGFSRYFSASGRLFGSQQPRNAAQYTKIPKFAAIIDGDT